MSTLEAHLSEYRQHEGGLRRLVATLIRGQQNQDDLIQGLLKRLLGRDKPIDRPFPEWAARTLRSLASNERRRASRMRAREINSAPLRRESTPDDGEWHAILEERRAELLAIINELPPEPRNLILLRYFRGQEPKDIAKSMGIASNTVRSRLHSALDALRNRLEASPSGGLDLLLLRMLPLAVPNSPFDCADPDQVEIVLRRVMSTSILNTATAKLLVTAAGLLVLATVAWSILQPSLDSLTPISTAASTLHTHGTTAATSTIPLIPDSPPSPAPILSSPFTAPTTADLLIRTTRHGKPLPHVAVVVDESGPEYGTQSRREGRTDENGELLMQSLPAVPVVVYYLQREDWAALTPGQLTTLNVAVDNGYDLSGTIVDRDGKPIPNSVAWIESKEAHTGRTPTAVADSSGSFNIRGMPAGRRILLARSSSGDFGTVLVTGGEGQSIKAIARCDQAGLSFGVICKDESGAPIRNTAVQAEIRGPQAPSETIFRFRYDTETDKEGEIQFSGFGEGIHEINLSIEGCVQAGSRISLPRESDMPLAVAFCRGFCIHGRVFRSDSKTPQAGAVVSLAQECDSGNYSTGFETVSRPDGSFSITGLPAGRYACRANHEDFLSSAISRFDLETEPTDPLILVLRSAQEVQVTVSDVRGNILKGVPVYLSPTEPWLQLDDGAISMSTSSDGPITRLLLDEGNYFIEVKRSTRDQGGLLRPVRKTFHTSEREITIIVEDLVLPTCCATGNIVDEQGKPLAHAPIHVLSEPGCLEDRANPRGFTVTDETGAFRMDSIFPGKLALKTETPTRELLILGTRELQTGETWDLGTIELATFGRIVVTSPPRKLTESPVWLKVGISGSRIAEGLQGTGTPPENLLVAPGAYWIRFGNHYTLHEGHLLDAEGRWQLAAPTAPSFVIRPGQVLPIVLPSLPSKPIGVPIVIEGPSMPPGSTLGYAFETTSSEEASPYRSDTCKINGLPFTLTENLGIGTYRLRAGVGELRGEVSFSVTEADLERGSLDLKVPLTLTLK